MNQALTDFWKSVKDQEIAVIGIGISNRPLIEYLVRLGARVTACDKRERQDLGKTAEELESMGVSLCLGENYLKHLTQKIIFKTPGMRYDTPELLSAKANGAVVTSEMEVFFNVCPSHIIAVTGSDGKTTTTTLIHKMMTAAGYKTWLGGNIGHPLLSEAEQMKPEDWVILELSSFQLHTMQKSPEIAVMTNLSPNHLDVHKDYQEYIDAKKNIFLYQDKNSIFVTNAHNKDTNALIPEARGKVLTFSSDPADHADIIFRDDTIYVQDQPFLKRSDILLPGMHNVENYMAAIGAVGSMVSRNVILEIAKSFGGVAHRIELIRTLHDVRYYNSSIDSSPNRTINTLSVFPEKVILIAGGKDKGIPYDALGKPLLEHVKYLILIGATFDKIYESLKTAAGGEIPIPVYRAQDYPDAVTRAQAESQPGDVVLLSPASTSFDLFRNFEERGNLFRTIVENLK